MVMQGLGRTCTLLGLGLLSLLLGISAGAEGWSWGWAAWSADQNLIMQLRLPRAASAWLAGAALGLAGAIAQGLFRNPLADPYLLGSAAGAHLAVSLVLAASSALAGASALGGFGGIGIPLAAFLGALAGVLCSLLLAGGLREGPVLLLAGVVVGMLMAAAAETLALMAPDILRARQAFLLGTTAFAGPESVMTLGIALALGLALALPCARALDALTLGDDAARTLGLPLSACRALLIAALALTTGAAVAQVGLVGFVGLAAPHLVRAMGPALHRGLLIQSALCGGALLGLADALCRGLAAPTEWPTGLLTALLGGGYLLIRLRQRASVEPVR
ncbi:MAG: FecCD family ABC transporter permease [Burkholderiales bacterium]|jgi:iron complex transport system permease protein